jgi:hypothetical protein
MYRARVISRSGYAGRESAKNIGPFNAGRSEHYIRAKGSFSVDMIAHHWKWWYEFHI